MNCSFGYLIITNKYDQSIIMGILVYVIITTICVYAFKRLTFVKYDDSGMYVNGKKIGWNNVLKTKTPTFGRPILRIDIEENGNIRTIKTMTNPFTIQIHEKSINEFITNIKNQNNDKNSS
jgi:hypothetical protein